MSEETIKYVDISIKNSADAPINCDFAKQSNDIILKHMETWDVNVIRFKIPASAISQLNITDSSWKVSLLRYCIKGYTGFGETTGANERIVSLPLTSEYPIETKQDLIEVLNRSIWASWRDMCYNWFPSNATATERSNQTVNSTVTLSKASPSTTFAFTGRTGTIATSSKKHMRFGYLQVKFNSLAYNTATLPEDCKFKLTYPNGQVVWLLSLNPLYQADTTVNEITNLYIEDAGHHNIDDLGTFVKYNTQTATSNVSDLSSYRFHAQSSMYDTAGTETGEGTYTLTLVGFGAVNTVDIDVDITMHWSYDWYQMGSLTQSTPSMPPVFGYNSASDTISMVYSELWGAGGWKLGLSKELSNMLGFRMANIVDYPDDYNTSLNQIVLPQYPYTAALDQEVSITAEKKSSYLIDQFHSLQIRTNIPVDSEFHTTNVQTDSDFEQSILTDFIPDINGTRDYLIFNATDNYRKYNILGSGDLTALSLSIWNTFDDGTSNLVQLNKNQICNVKLQFTKRVN